MKNKNHIEPQKAQTKISRKLTEQGEISTNTDIMQVDNQATTSQQNAPKIDKHKRGGKENYYFNNSEHSDVNLLNADFILSEALTEEHSISNETDEAILQAQSEQTAFEEQEDDVVEELMENTGDVYFLRAKELYDCKDSQIYNLAVNTIRSVHHNTKAGWLLIGIAAYRARINAERLSGGAGNTDDQKSGRVNAIRKLAEDCAAKGTEISFSTLYDYSHWVETLLEEPLRKFAGDKKTIRRERIVLMEKLFTLPPSIAKTVSTGSEAAKKLEIACQLEKEKGSAITNAELKKALGDYFKPKKIGDEAASDYLDGSEAGESEADNELEPNAGDDISETDNENNLALRPADDNRKIETNPNLAGALASHTNNEAKRVHLEPETVKDLYVSFLQMMLSTAQNMGVKK